jgi:tripartite-type tricarboxylate transporter receptor subunit TctC
MNRIRRRLAKGIAGATALASLAPFSTRAQASWPRKPIRIVVGFPAGGLTDSLARAYGEYLSQKLGQSVIVENKAGAAGMLAGAEVARAAPDGYTFWFTITATTNQNRVFFKKMPYDPDKDFVHVAGFDPGPLLLGVNSESPIRNMRDLAEYGKKQRITFGNYSAGSLPHMMAQQLSKKYGLVVEPVPYKGEAPMWVDLASGQITVALGSTLAISPHLQSGKVRAIAVSTRARSPLLPQVPTFAEQGLSEPVFTLQGWIGLFAPANTPRSIVQRVSDLVQEAANSTRVRELNKTFGMGAMPWNSAEFEKLDRENKPYWIELARELNLTFD